jgi:nucleotide-binding universal stress UspA family protein
MLPKISRILFATALSDRSAYTLRHVVALAAATGAEIRILHVLPSLSDDARLVIEAYMTDNDLRDRTLSHRLESTRQSLTERQDRFWSGLDPAAQKVRAQVVAVDVVEGAAVDTILGEARRHGCDLIVLGTHEEGFTHHFLGETARRVLRQSPIPTLVIPFHD